MVQIRISSLAVVAAFVLNFMPAIAAPTVSALETREKQPR
jgi:hypothetical protein